MSTDTPPPPTAPRHPRADTHLSAACRNLWPGRHAAELAAFTGRPKATCRAWLSGRRRPPVSVLRAVASALHSRAQEALSIEAFLKTEADARDREPVRRQGWASVCERSGPGSVPRDNRWRGGRKSRC